MLICVMHVMVYLLNDFLKGIIAQPRVDRRIDHRDKIAEGPGREKTPQIQPFYTLNIIDGIMSVGEVMAVARKYDATLTEYINAVLLYALLAYMDS